MCSRQWLHRHQQASQGLLFCCQHATACERNARQWELSASLHSHSHCELPKRHALPLLNHYRVIPVSRLCAHHLQLLLRRCLLNHCQVRPVSRLCARPLQLMLRRCLLTPHGFRESMSGARDRRGGQDRCLLTPHGSESMSGAQLPRGTPGCCGGTVQRVDSRPRMHFPYAPLSRRCTVQRVDSKPRVHVPYASISHCSRAALARGVSAAMRIL